MKESKPTNKKTEGKAKVSSTVGIKNDTSKSFDQNTAENTEQKPVNPRAKTTKKDDLFVVGVGASAGGLDALSKFLSPFNGVTSEFCVVVVMHLSPNHKSELTSILSKRCKWPVKTIENDMKMQPRNIYVTPANHNLHVEGRILILDELPKVYQSAPSINKFLSSIADTNDNRAVGVVLSGFGSDGAEGIVAIKKNNGFTIAQSPESAEHNSMPISAMETNHVDAVLDPEQMFDEVKRYCQNSRYVASSPTKKKSIDAIFELLEKRSGTDFSLYKPSTIMRRINRRMDDLQSNSITDYYEKIKESPQELDLLFNTVLIGVTEFFRDKEAYNALRFQLEDMIGDKQPGDSIRIWSVGCATGEEPYSICILLHEILGRDISRYNIQIFASDIDDRALNIGRKGVYPIESLDNLSQQLRERYFLKKSDYQYEINKVIKQHILFSKHDISNHPPYVKLDLVSCRNLLIYFNNDLQKQTFQIFHYALKPQGILFLGKSESVGVAADLFEKNGKYKIFRKSETALGYDLKFSRFGRQQSVKKESNNKHSKNLSLIEVAKETIYHKFVHPFVIINPQAEIKEVHGSHRLYLEISEGAMNANLYKMANEELVTSIKAVLAQVKKTGVQHISPTLKFTLYSAIHYVKIRIAPMLYTIGDIQYFLVIFEKVVLDEETILIQKKLETEDFADLRVKQLEDELVSTREHLQIFTEEIEATNEELQTINEELQSSNEELRSSNEELETSNEELQSANEELNTANNELRLTNEALIEKENELQEEKAKSERNELIYRSIAENIPNGTVCILNHDFVFEYAQGIELREVNLKEADLIGKTFFQVEGIKTERELIEDAFQKTLEGETKEFELNYKDRYYNIYTVPLKINGDGETKIMFLAQNITEQKNRVSKLNTAIRAANLLIYVWHAKADVFEDNEVLNEYLGFRKETVVTGPMFMELIHDDDHKQLQEQWEKAKETGIITYEARVNRPDELRYVRVFGEVVFDAEGEPDKVIATLIDITEDKRLLHQIQSREERFKVIADSSPVIIWVTNENGEFTYLNKPWFDFTDEIDEENLTQGWQDRLHPEDKDSFNRTIQIALKNHKRFGIECRLKSSQEEYSWFMVRGNPIFDFEDKFEGFIGSCVDIDEQKEFTNKLEDMVSSRTMELNESNSQLVKANMNLEEYAYAASHDLQEPIRKIRTFNSIVKDLIDNEEALNYSNRIEASAERMTNLVQNVLDYSKLNESTFVREEVDLNSVIEFVKDDLELVIKEKNAKIEYGDLGNINGLEVQLNQLFSNLIKNSLKFTENEPHIKIGCDMKKGKELLQTFDADPKENYHCIIVSDNGIGINPEYKDQIFKPFKRLNSKQQFAGTGIGLAICKRIVDLHQGYIDIDKDYKDGTSFIIYLPH